MNEELHVQAPMDRAKMNPNTLVCSEDLSTPSPLCAPCVAPKVVPKFTWKKITPIKVPDDYASKTVKPTRSFVMNHDDDDSTTSEDDDAVIRPLHSFVSASDLMRRAGPTKRTLESEGVDILRNTKVPRIGNHPSGFELLAHLKRLLGLHEQIARLDDLVKEETEWALKVLNKSVVREVIGVKFLEEEFSAVLYELEQQDVCKYMMRPMRGVVDRVQSKIHENCRKINQ